MRVFLVLLAAASLLTACGKKGPPIPAGPADQITWPKNYPRPPAGETP